LSSTRATFGPGRRARANATWDLIAQIRDRRRHRRVVSHFMDEGGGTVRPRVAILERARIHGAGHAEGHWGTGSEDEYRVRFRPDGRRWTSSR